MISVQHLGQKTSDIQTNKKAAKRPSQRSALHDNLCFDPKHTFDMFVAGNNNFAFAAAVAVAQAPGKMYNPLFLHGGVGLGKTHLLHAIGQHVAAHKKGVRVEYVSCESLNIEFIDCVLRNQLARFRKKYRQADVLLIDDVQFLTNTERIQEEFFHTFNALFEEQKQIVLACDRPASEIQNLEQRLVSRLEGGLLADLQPPDAETRLAILHKKAQLMGVQMPEEIMEFLATRIHTNVRRLQGALIRVAVYATLTGRKPSLEMVEDLLREILDKEGRPSITIDVIQKRVADHFHIGLADLTSRQRPESIAFPREVAMYLSRQLTECTLSAIGYAFGDRNHGTVLHACRLLKGRMEVDPNVRQVVSYLERQLVR
jgi:chromosomal replication initiator protein